MFINIFVFHTIFFMSLLFSQFLDYKVYNQGISTKTHKHYLSSLELANQVLIDLDDVSIYNDHKQFTTLLAKAKHIREWSPVTYNTYRKLYSTFCAWLLSEGVISKNPFDKIPKMKEPRKIPKFYSRNQIHSIKQAVLKVYGSQSFLDMRNMCIIYTLFYTWIRLNEMLELELHHVDLFQRTIFVQEWKGWKDRIVPIHDALYPYIERYMLLRAQCYFTKNTNSFFSSVNGAKLTYKNMYSVFNRLSEQTGFHIRTHNFRHTFATELIRNNIDVYNVSQVLGHSSIRTTQIYLSANMNSIAQSINSASLYQ